MKDRVFNLTAGFVIGLLFAFLGTTKLFNNVSEQASLVQTRTVEKIVVRTKTLVKTSTIEKTVQLNQVFRASLVDASGNTTQSWDVVKCRFLVIGATLTDRSGKTFEVRGKIKIEPLEKGAI